MNGSKFETNIENREARMTNDERRRKPVPRAACVSAPKARRLLQPGAQPQGFETPHDQALKARFKE